MRHKYKKELFTHKPGGTLPGIVVAENENLQSKFVVQKVLELREQGIPLNTIAVLFRSGYLSFDLEIELNKANIPFVKFGGFKFIETAHIKDLVAYLRVLDNPRDAVAWNRLLLLVDGVGPRTAEKVIDDIQARRVNTSTGGTSTTLPAFWAGFQGYPDKVRALFDALKDASPSHVAPADKVQMLLRYYEPIFKRRYDDFNKRRKDLDMFQQITERYRHAGDIACGYRARTRDGKCDGHLSPRNGRRKTCPLHHPQCQGARMAQRVRHLRPGRPFSREPRGDER